MQNPSPHGEIIFISNVYRYTNNELHIRSDGEFSVLVLDTSINEIIDFLQVSVNSIKTLIFIIFFYQSKYLQGRRSNFAIKSNESNCYFELEDDEFFPDILDDELQNEALEQLRSVCRFAIRYRQHLADKLVPTASTSSPAVNNLRMELTVSMLDITIC